MPFVSNPIIIPSRVNTSFVLSNAERNVSTNTYVRWHDGFVPTFSVIAQTNTIDRHRHTWAVSTEHATAFHFPSCVSLAPFVLIPFVVHSYSQTHTTHPKQKRHTHSRLTAVHHAWYMAVGDSIKTRAPNGNKLADRYNLYFSLSPCTTSVAIYRYRTDTAPSSIFFSRFILGAVASSFHRFISAHRVPCGTEKKETPKQTHTRLPANMEKTDSQADVKPDVNSCIRYTSLCMHNAYIHNSTTYPLYNALNVRSIFYLFDEKLERLT